jgi:hypothetical protein
MRANLPFPQRSLIASCVRLVHTTFFDTLPATDERRPTAPADALPAGATAGGQKQSSRWITWLDNWFHQQAMKEREAYLSQAQDVFDLENRIRRLERRPYY